MTNAAQAVHNGWEYFDAAPAVAVAEAEFRRLLGHPSDHTPGPRVEELAAWARSWYAANGRPWVYLREAQLDVTAGGLKIDGSEFRSNQFQEHMRGHQAVRAVLAVASAGRECEEHARRLWEEGKPDEYYFLEIFGSAVVEHLVAGLSARICGMADQSGLRAIPHYSPGYSGWDVADQNRLFELVASRTSRPFPGPIEVMTSGMLRPKKSLLAVIGLTAQPAVAGADAAAVPCVACAFSPCQYRRAPYRHAGEAAKPVAAAAPIVGKYTVSERALRKWAQERVQLEPQTDGTILARFRFDGTTCSNQGRPLAFDYTVRLGAPAAGCMILHTDCQPAADDDGYAHMCSYLKDGTKLMAEIAAESPLLGRPLNDVLFWNRESASAGCYCSPTSRTHKWGLALEAIHYSLVHSPRFSSQLHATTALP